MGEVVCDDDAHGIALPVHAVQLHVSPVVRVIPTVLLVRLDVEYLKYRAILKFYFLIIFKSTSKNFESNISER